jgi:hypothetical protein
MPRHVSMAMRKVRLAAASVALAISLSQPPVEAESAAIADGSGAEATQGEPRASGPGLSGGALCRILAEAARDHELPVAFFRRLIWQESRFNPSAISRKGALGIAQFMPATAAARGLADPLEPLLALRESASYLHELSTTFRGNLGLAAAAYNAGPGRVEAWLAGRRGLPSETRSYVRIVTGHTAEAWASPRPPQWQDSDVREAPCVEVASVINAAPPRPSAAGSNPAWGPWGVQLAGHWSEGQVLASYERLRRTYHGLLRDRLPLLLRAHLPGRPGTSKYVVRVAESSRLSADALCAKLRAAGGACAVLRNPPPSP